MTKSSVLVGLSLLIVTGNWAVADMAMASSIKISPNSSATPVQSVNYIAQTNREESLDSATASLEAQILAEINRARTNPTQYAQWLEAQKPYYRRKFLNLPDATLVVTEEGVAALEDAIEFFQQLEPLPPLENVENLSLVAQDYLRQALTIRGVDNNNAQLNTLAERYGISPPIVSSSISSDATAEYLVMQLIVDDGIEGRVHQQNILDPNLVNVGVACQRSSSRNQRCILIQTAAIDSETETESNGSDSDQTAAVSEQEVWLRQGVLEDGDGTIASDGSLYDVYQIEMKAGESYVITLESDEFDTFLAVSDTQNQIIEQNDDIDSNNSNSQLTVTMPEDGVYKIIVNSYQTTGRGRYILKIE